MVFNFGRNNKVIRELQDRINELQETANSNTCTQTSESTNSGSGSGSGGGSGNTGTNTPYDIYQDYTAEQNKFIEFENILTDEYLNQLETKSKAQNEELEKAFSTHFSKIQYQTEQISSLNFYVYYLIWIYAIIAVIFLGFLFAGQKSKKTSIYLKLFITLLLVLYPYYITDLEDILMSIGNFVFDEFYGNIYIKSEY